jgi:hypothetical protein
MVSEDIRNTGDVPQCPVLIKIGLTAGEMPK